MTELEIKLLDCTLRDGGYVNDWQFGQSTAVCVLERLAEARVDVIEVGFLDERRQFDPSRTIQPDTKSFDEILSTADRHGSMLVAMIDYGTCGLEHISPCSESVLDGIRLIFKQPKMYDAVQFGRALMKLGYKVFLQMVSITAYSDRDMLDFIDLVNEVPPYAVSMVDTYGLLQKEELLHYFYLLDRNLKKGIRIGYHSHNNFQLAFANTCELIKRKADHDVLVDGTLYGMGKSAGNAPIELIAMYLNENYGKNYDISQLLEAIDANVLRIYHQRYWGYNLLYYLSASNDCHPNYIDYLLNKRTLSVRSINEIVKDIPAALKLNYQQKCIEELYLDYQKKTIAGERSIRELVSGKEILILGPGKTLLTHSAKIRAYMQSVHPVSVSVNFVPAGFDIDAVFISNAKRYSSLLTELKKIGDSVSMIATSNITSAGKAFDYVLDYAKLLDSDRVIEDNALIMLLNALDDCAPASVTLAGFDGFGSQVNESYYDDSMELSMNYQRLAAVNESIMRRIPMYREKLGLTFLTPSLYENNGGAARYQAVLFDLDGTLLDTSEGIMKATDYIVQKYRLPMISGEEKRLFIGPAIQDSLMRCYSLSSERAWEIANAWREVYKDMFLFDASPYEGTFELLRFCNDHGIKTCVATNKREDYARTLLDHFGFTPLLSCVVGTDMDGKLTKADLIKACIEKIGVMDLSKCLMIGDTQGDKTAATQAGVDFLGVTYGFGFGKGTAVSPVADSCEEIEKYIIQTHEKYGKGVWNWGDEQ